MTVTIHFHGAAGTVTGSCYRVVHDKGQFLVDCGMFQGNKTVRDLNYKPLPFDAQGDRLHAPDARPHRSRGLAAQAQQGGLPQADLDDRADRRPLRISAPRCRRYPGERGRVREPQARPQGRRAACSALRHGRRRGGAQASADDPLRDLDFAGTRRARPLLERRAHPRLGLDRSRSDGWRQAGDDPLFRRPRSR